MEKAKSWLKGMSWLYMIYAILGIVFMLISISSNEAMQAIAGQTNGIDPKIFVGVTAVTSALVYLWFWWLIRRIINDKSKGTLLMVLLILGLVGAIVGFFVNQRVTGIVDLILDVITLIAIYKVRSQE
ncbi:MAG: hypothetical protein IKF83_00275 [Clostridia bacterium]|nr:hypothetical protein [Clostridia bacterium]